MFFTFITICVIASILILHNRFKDHLDNRAWSLANASFADRYYDTRFETPLRKSLELRGYRVIYRNKGHKTTIHLHQVKSVHARFYWLTVHLKNGEVVRLPTSFTRLSEIYAILKYHRPHESRAVVSTRSQQEHNTKDTQKTHKD